MTTEPGMPRLTVEDWTLLRSRLVWCYEGEVRPEHRWLRSRSHHLCAWLVLAGEVELRQGCWSWRARAGEWLLAGPEPFQQSFSAGAKILSVNFRLEWPSGESLVTQTMVFPVERYPKLSDAARTLVRFVARRFPSAHVDLWRQDCGFEDFFELQRVFSRWVSVYLRTVSAEGAAPMRLRGIDPRVATALRRLDRQAWTEELSEPALAKEIGVSVGHMERLFSRATGLTPRGYLHKRRVEAAVAALADATRPIKQTAYELGFVSAAHFSNWVKKATGRSPREHRRAGAGKGGEGAGEGAGASRANKKAGPKPGPL